MTLSPGAVVWHEAPFEGQDNGESLDRPWLLVSNHPFHGNEYVGLGMTTTERNRAISVGRADWVDGGIRRTGYVSPWFAMTLKADDVTHRVGALEPDVVDEAVARLFDCPGTGR